ncbi:TonB-dependent receptor [Rubellicoccus peritrichatus]|uniref:TonB-dependent receptor n=1 Tax=Rubellicoccus peritrichatus TaxID=3080537 RepID=A0AAQ3L5Y5_9BACT|nr:TonB-dependent receptor [Puniceicoccus sp. CR14]WOO39860.1 TonB-dependent receptor [Puniceicoccus sp. CR14]
MSSSSSCAIFFCLSQVLVAQEELKPVADQEEPIVEMEPFVVTGSLLTTDDIKFFSPTTTLTYEDLILTGSQTPIESLRLLPSFFGAMNTENDSNGGIGTASPNIRAIGTLRTLTLINGRRAGGNSAFGLQPGGFADLNLIPQAAISEIEIYKAAASTTYGSDAIGGVVNVLLDDRFEGVRANALYGDTTEGGGAVQQYSVTGGFNVDEDTHITVLASYYDRTTVWARDRDLSKTTNFISRGGTNRGSATFPGTAQATTNGGLNGILAPGVTIPTSSADYVTYNQNTDAFNFNEFAPAIPGQEIVSGYGAIQHDLTDQVMLYGDVLYTYTDQDNGLAPAPWSASAFSPPAFFSAVENSPHNPFAAGELQQVNYRSFELGDLKAGWQRNAVRLVGGATGEIDERWIWDSAVLYTQENITGSFTGIADATLLTPFIQSGQFNPFASVSQGVNNGIAFDNAAALQAAATSAQNKYFENLFSYDAKVQGDLIELPAGSLTGAIGAEYRYESISVDPDPLWASGNNLGGGGLTSSFTGQRNVGAVFAETIVPLVAPGQHVTGVHRLDLDLGLRFEGFDDRGQDPLAPGTEAPNSYNNLSWKAALGYQPTEGITMSGSFATGFRAPTLYESYSTQVVDFPILIDSTGASPPGLAIPTIVRGNPNLDPETSRSWSAGIGWEPQQIEGLAFGIDYYHVTIDDAIANGAQFTLDANNPSSVIRDPVTGQVNVVFSQFFNASSITTQGLEYTVSYDHEVTDGFRIRTSLGVNQVLTYRADVPGIGDISFLGRYVDKRSNNLSPGAVPRWKGLATIFFFVRNFTFGTTVNYIGSYEDDPAFTTNGEGRTVDDFAALNLVAAYTFESSGSSWLDGLTATVGVDNVFDTPPPFAAGAFADGYDTSLYSIRNRFVYGALSKRF